MKTILSMVLLVVPTLLYGQATKAPVLGSNRDVAVGANPSIVTPYQMLVGELLKELEGVDKKVAVTGFSYSDGRDSRDGGVVVERITTELVKSKKVKVIERKEITKVFEELKFQRSGAIDSGSAKEIGKMLGADLVIVGTLAELPDKQIEINARVVGIESGEVLSAASARLKKDWIDEFRKLLVAETKLIEETARKSESIPKPDKSNGLNAAKKYYERGVTNSDLKEYDKAIADFGIAIALYPAYAEAYFNRGVAYGYKGDSDKAIIDFEKLRELSPTYWKAYYGLGYFYAGKYNYDKAIENFNVAIELNPDSALIHGFRGFMYSVKGDFDKAIQDYNRVIEIDPKYPRIYRDRGDAYYSMRSYEAAIDDYSLALSLNPSDANVYMNRGLVYVNLGERDKAVADFKKLLDIDSTLVYNLGKRAVEYDQKGEYDKAIETYSIVIDILSVRPGLQWPWAYYSRGTSYGHKKDFNRAIADVTKAIEIDPTIIEGYFMRGLYYKIQENYTLAINDYSKLIEIAPDDAEAYYHRGNSYSAKKEYKAAISDYTKAIEIDPSLSAKYFEKHYPWLGAMTQKAIGKYYLARGQAYSYISKSDKAMSDAYQAMKLDPELEAQAKSTIEFAAKWR